MSDGINDGMDTSNLLDRERTAYEKVLERAEAAARKCRELEAELRRSWRSWPPEGPEREVACLRLVERTFVYFETSSTAETLLPHEVLYRELEEPQT